MTPDRKPGQPWPVYAWVLVALLVWLVVIGLLLSRGWA